MAGRTSQFQSVIFTCLFTMAEQNRTPLAGATRKRDPKSSVPVYVATALAGKKFSGLDFPICSSGIKWSTNLKRYLIKRRTDLLFF